MLDVGCHDGSLLGLLESRVRVGLDPVPLPAPDSVLMVQADGRRLPFCSGSFDQVIAADVIEHVPDDVSLVQEIVRVMRRGGKLFVTTPSVDIRMFPPFLTGWISTKWGHYWRRGYTEEDLRELVGGRYSCSILQWNAPAYRFWYLPLRLLSAVWPALARRFVGSVATWDTHHSAGRRGFYWMCCEEKDT